MRRLFNEKEIDTITYLIRAYKVSLHLKENQTKLDLDDITLARQMLKLLE